MEEIDVYHGECVFFSGLVCGSRGQLTIGNSFHMCIAHTENTTMQNILAFAKSNTLNGGGGGKKPYTHIAFAFGM